MDNLPIRNALFLFLSIFLLSGSTAHGQVVAADTTESMKIEIAQLRERLASLEAKLIAVDIRTNEVSQRVRATPSIEEGPVTDFARKIEVHGFVDTAFIFNTNTPVPPNPSTNNLRVFDTNADGFMLNNMQLNLEKKISRDSPAGFRVDLDFGQDAQAIHSNGLGIGGAFAPVTALSYDSFDLQQAYGQFMFPRSIPFADTLSFKAGKFATLMGAEVIESMNNWNYSRSLLFGYAIPFTHTGLRIYWKPSSDVPFDGTVGIVNGWDQGVDLNRAKTIEVQANYSPLEALTLTAGGMFGPERADSNKDYRCLVDLIATYKVTDRLTLKANYDYAWEKDATSVTAVLVDPKNGSWDGLAIYAKYDILDWWSVAARWEYLRDMDGMRTGVVNTAAMPVTDLFVTEITLTNEFRLYKDIIARLEYRYDKASNQVFFKDKGYANNQSTLACEVIAGF